MQQLLAENTLATLPDEMLASHAWQAPTDALMQPALSRWMASMQQDQQALPEAALYY
jgi:hypothetical protein